MVFMEGDDGLFYMKPDFWRKKKYDFFAGEIKVVEKTKKNLIENMKEKDFIVRGHYSKDDLHKLAVDYNTPLTNQVDVIEPRQCG